MAVLERVEWRDPPAGWEYGDPLPPDATPIDAGSLNGLEQRIADAIADTDQTVGTLAADLAALDAGVGGLADTIGAETAARAAAIGALDERVDVLEALELLGGGAVDGLEAVLLLQPAAGTQQSAIIVESPDADWSLDAQALDVYGGAQAFVVLKEDDGTAATVSDRVLFRVNGLGGMGLAGGMHVATGLRARPGQEFSYSINIEPEVDVPGVIIQQGGAGTAPFLLLFDQAGVEVGKITDGGTLQLDGTITSDGVITADADNPAHRTIIGNQFGFASLALGDGPGTTGNLAYVHGIAGGVLGLNPAGKIVELMSQSALEFAEGAADPAAPTANKARLFAKDNGAGKTQLCVRFQTGAVAVLATQP